MTTAGSDNRPGFGAELRSATEDAHQEAENAPFVGHLLAGRLQVADYARLAAQLHAVYSVLEEAVAVNTDPVLEPFLTPELTRLPSLAADLEHLAGLDWATRFPVLPATAAYRDRLRVVCFDQPARFLAHHYVRYLGDLSGGQLVGRVLQRVFGFEDHRGTEFYRFPDIARPKLFKDRYRKLLDDLPWPEDERRKLIEEASLAFQLNTDVFGDLASQIPAPTSGQ